MAFSDYKIDVIKHEVGHWVVAKFLGFRIGDIQIEILSDRRSLWHTATTKIQPEPDINNLDSLLKYIEDRVCILFAGVISQVLDKPNTNEETAANLLDTCGADDNGKIKDLLFISRGITYSGSILESNKIDHINAIQSQYWKKANELVRKNANTILFISEKIASVVDSRNKRYLFRQEELSSWFSDAAA
ncbi:MAG: hypothetical protein JSS57_06905 [Proteobacteria bacterium]|nr:hypothetical protein [Pseudomonadota bacterium]